MIGNPNCFGVRNKTVISRCTSIKHLLTLLCVSVITASRVVVTILAYGSPHDMQASEDHEITGTVDDDDECEDEYEEGAPEESSDEELNLRMFGIHQALPVEGEPDWTQGGATSHQCHGESELNHMLLCMQQLFAKRTLDCSCCVACS
jgi:hypothetical protein